MNEDYRLLENIASFLKQGYLMEEIISICKAVYPNSKIKLIETALNEGTALDEAIIKSNFNATFIEFFKFFRLQNNLAMAIEQSLAIWKTMNDTKNKLKKQLTYPCILIVFLVIFSLFIVYGLLPSVNQLFLEFDISPSILILIVFMLFKIIPILIIITILIFTCLLATTIYAIKKQYFKLLDYLVFKVPIINQLIRKYYSIKFALYYNELLLNGYDSTDIIITLYQKIDDSDIRMIVYEIYLKIIEGEALVDIISDFVYFEQLLVICFKLLLHNHAREKSLSDYLSLSLDSLNYQINKVMKIAIIFVYGFTAIFVIIVYLSIIIPMMNVVNNL